MDKVWFGIVIDGGGFGVNGFRDVGMKLGVFVIEYVEERFGECEVVGGYEGCVGELDIEVLLDVWLWCVVELWVYEIEDWIIGVYSGIEFVDLYLVKCFEMGVGKGNKVCGIVGVLLSVVICF